MTDRWSSHGYLYDRDTGDVQMDKTPGEPSERLCGDGRERERRRVCRSLAVRTLAFSRLPLFIQLFCSNVRFTAALYDFKMARNMTAIIPMRV